MIPLSAVEARAAEIVGADVLRHGSAVRRLEAWFAGLTGVPHAVALPSGLAALPAALRGLGIGPGAEVVLSPLTGAATVNAVLAVGATARFADVTAADYCVDPAAVAAAIGPRTQALLPVHLYGQPADLGLLVPLATEHGLALVEDATQALGATFDGHPAGSLGVGCFAPDTGAGGVVTTVDDRLAARLRLLRDHATRECRAHHPPTAGPWQPIPAIEARARNAERLSAGLAGLPGVVVPVSLPGRRHAWQRYTVRITPAARLSRDEVSERLAELGVASGVLHPRPVFDRFRGHPRVARADVPVAAALTRELLSLPVHPSLRTTEVESIVEAMAVALG